MSHRANYARLTFQQHLGPDHDSLDVPWAEFTGDSSETRAFEVPTADPQDPFIQMQVFEVGEYGHEILINGEALSGFDIATGERWQCWMDTVSQGRLTSGTNTIEFQRDTAGEDAFVVGSVVVTWREPLDDT